MGRWRYAYGNTADPFAGQDVACVGVVRRTVWDGAAELYEIQYPGDDSASTTTLEQDTTTLLPQSRYFGRVAYVHGLTLDRPLGLIRIGYVEPSNVVFPPMGIIPHWTWRGVPDFPSFDDGRASRCIGSACAQVIFPAGLTPFLRSYYRATAWFGTLVDLKRDGSGQQYKRNRYYDPNTGRFTQEDPIGLAGGLNSYGFANGDPVNYSDPFGLCWQWGNSTQSNYCAPEEGVVGETPSALDVAAVVAVPGGGEAAVAGEGAAAATVKATARVIGSYLEYLNVGRSLGAKVFNVPGDVWAGMSQEARWAANQKFLDRGIAAGADFISTVKSGAIRAGSALEKEVDYLVSKGYSWIQDGTRLIPP